MAGVTRASWGFGQWEQGRTPSYNGVIGCFGKVGDQRIVGASGFIKEFRGCGFREERGTTVQVMRKMAGCFGQLFTSVSGMAGNDMDGMAVMTGWWMEG